MYTLKDLSISIENYNKALILDKTDLKELVLNKSNFYLIFLQNYQITPIFFPRSSSGKGKGIYVKQGVSVSLKQNTRFYGEFTEIDHPSTSYNWPMASFYSQELLDVINEYKPENARVFSERQYNLNLSLVFYGIEWGVIK